MKKGLFLTLLMGCFGWTNGLAQQTNLEQYQALALRCLSAAPDGLPAFMLDAPGQMPYVRAALVNAWQEAGHQVHHADTTALPLLAYEIETVAVQYEKAARKTYNRTVTLHLRYTMTGTDGRIMHDDRCTNSLSDTITRKERETLENPAYPETQAAVPQGWLRRYLEPAALTTATAISVYLFFTLRSNRTDSGS